MSTQFQVDKPNKGPRHHCFQMHISTRGFCQYTVDTMNWNKMTITEIPIVYLIYFHLETDMILSSENCVFPQLLCISLLRNKLASFRYRDNLKKNETLMCTLRYFGTGE